MRVWALLPVLLVLMASLPSFAAEGIFEGTVVRPPSSESASPDWIFVEGGNHLLRRVEVAHAVIVFDPEIFPNPKRKCGPECLSAGQEVRVTADQDSSGEWRARRVEILRDAVKRQSGLTAEMWVPKALARMPSCRNTSDENARSLRFVSPLRNLIQTRVETG